MTTIDYGGTARHVCGRARYPSPPDLGTIVGPKDTTREYMVVIGHQDGLTLFAYATVPDMQAASDRLGAGDAPRSVTEIQAGHMSAIASSIKAVHR